MPNFYHLRRKALHSCSILAAGFFPLFALLVFSGSLLTYSQFLCAALCSALTASLVGVAKSVLQTIIGFFTFGGVRFHPLNVLGGLREYLCPQNGAPEIGLFQCIQCFVNSVTFNALNHNNVRFSLL